ncbi:hypothetical protein SVIOM342S_04221 [Streptomyces violaceorubidus]
MAAWPLALITLVEVTGPPVSPGVYFVSVVPAPGYDRAAYPDSIEYGMREPDLTSPAARVDLVAAQRCLASATVCDGANFDKTDDPGAYRPGWDSPGNLNCKATSKLCPAFPSFWTRLRLSAVTTYAQRPGSAALQKVDTYTLHQSFPEDWYATSPGWWLNSITRTGYGPGDSTGTVQSKDGVSFAHYTVGSSSPLRTRLKDRQLPVTVQDVSGDGVTDLVYRTDVTGRLLLRKGIAASGGGVDLTSLAAAARQLGGGRGHRVRRLRLGSAGIPHLIGTPDVNGDAIPDIWTVGLRRARSSRSSARAWRRRVCRAAVVAVAGQSVRSG